MIDLHIKIQTSKHHIERVQLLPCSFQIEIEGDPTPQLKKQIFAFLDDYLQKKRGTLPPLAREKLPPFTNRVLSELDFETVVSFAKTEKWPFTSQGLYKQIEKEGVESCDSELLSYFCHTSEFVLLETLG